MAIGMRNDGPALEIERIRSDAEQLGRSMEVLPDPETTDPAEYEQRRTDWLHQVITGRANLNGELDKYPGLRDVQQEAAEVAEQKEGWLTTVRNTPVIKQACDVAQWGWNQVTEHPVRTGLIVLGGVLAWQYRGLLYSYLNQLFAGAPAEAITETTALDMPIEMADPHVSPNPIIDLPDPEPFIEESPLSPGTPGIPTGPDELYTPKPQGPVT